VNERDAERLAAGAPRAVRETILRTLLPGLGAAIEQVRVDPRRIRRQNVGQARRIVSLVEDPELLAAIADHENRVSVREALREHPLWQNTPHERSCVHCARTPVLRVEDLDVLRNALGPRGHRSAASEHGVSAECDEQIMRTLAILDPDVRSEFWQLAFKHKLLSSVRARVELAAGRTPLAPGDVPRWEGRNQPRMRRLLADEPVHTPALLELAVLSHSVPRHWKVTIDEWCQLLKEYETTVLNGNFDVPLAAIERHWGDLLPRSRVLSLRHVSEVSELERLLASLDAEDTVEAKSNDACARTIVDLLHRFPQLDTSRRLGLVAMLPRREIGEYLLGRLGTVPEPAEIDDVLVLYGMGQRAPGHRVLIDAAGRNETPGEHRRVREHLIDALVRSALPRELFAAENRVSFAAHRFTWENLTEPAAIVAFAGLLEEWTGTLPELVETALELSR
jgi:hypothetical protein